MRILPGDDDDNSPTREPTPINNDDLDILKPCHSERLKNKAAVNNFPPAELFKAGANELIVCTQNLSYKIGLEENVSANLVLFPR